MAALRSGNWEIDGRRSGALNGRLGTTNGSRSRVLSGYKRRPATPAPGVDGDWGSLGRGVTRRDAGGEPDDGNRQS
jgi:hypothetical protein